MNSRGCFIKKQSLFMMRKMMPTGKVGDFSRGKVTDAEILINFSNVHNVFPFYFGGTFVKTELLKKKKRQKKK